MGDSEAKRLLFYQVCGGDFARSAQVEFERLQEMVVRHEKALTVTMKITVHPHDKRQGYPVNFGEVEFEITPPSVKRKSERYVTEVKNGVIVGDGKSVDEILQYELFPENEDKTLLFSKKEVSGE